MVQFGNHTILFLCSKLVNKVFKTYQCGNHSAKNNYHIGTNKTLVKINSNQI